MQPENQQAPNPTSPSSQYDFIYNGEQKPKRKFSLPNPSANLGKFVALFCGGAVVLIIIIILFSNIFLGSKVNTKELIDVIAQGQEIARVSDLAAQQSRDATTQGLASTTSSALSSDQAQIKQYLAKAKQKIDKKQLALKTDKKTDEDLKAAAQNNGLEAFYFAYLKKNLNSYKSSVKTAFDGAPSKAKPILDEAYVSAGTILAAPQLATTP